MIMRYDRKAHSRRSYASALIWSALFSSLTVILITLGYKFYNKSHIDNLKFEIAEFQKQTATFSRPKSFEYYPDEYINIEWLFDPIDHDEDFTLISTVIFENMKTNRIYLTNEVVILPFFNQLQFQSSKQSTVRHLRKIETTYQVPHQVSSGDYVIKTCQQFSHEGLTTSWSCYESPEFKVRLTPRGS